MCRLTCSDQPPRAALIEGRAELLLGLLVAAGGEKAEPLLSLAPRRNAGDARLPPLSGCD